MAKSAYSNRIKFLNIYKDTFYKYSVSFRNVYMFLSSKSVNDLLNTKQNHYLYIYVSNIANALKSAGIKMRILVRD